jgi:hypothetical protein
MFRNDDSVPGMIRDEEGGMERGAHREVVAKRRSSKTPGTKTSTPGTKTSTPVTNCDGRLPSTSVEQLGGGGRWRRRPGRRRAHQEINGELEEVEGTETATSTDAAPGRRT